MELLGAADSETLRQTVRDLWMSVYLDDGRSVCRLANGAFPAGERRCEAGGGGRAGGLALCVHLPVPMGTEEADKAIDTHGTAYKK